MGKLIQAALALFSGHPVRNGARHDERAGSAPATPVTDPETPDLSQEVERLHCWLMGCLRIAAGETGVTERAMLTELRHRIRERRLSRIPRQPRVLPVLIRALGDERQTHRDIAAIILDEPALTDELIRVVNHSRQQLDQRPVESVEQAVLMVGVEGVRRAVSEAVMRPVMQSASRTEAEFARHVWHWGLLCANASDLLDQQYRKAGSDLFMTALIPSLAYLTIYRELEAIAGDQAGSLTAAPSLVNAALHRESGRMLERLVEVWELPSRYADQLRELRENPLGNGESVLSRGMILGTREALWEAGRRTLSQNALLWLIRLEPRVLERLQASLRADPAAVR